MRIAKAAEQMLCEKLLPFWKALKDPEYGGFYGYVGYDLAVDKTAEKGCILNSRILWFFASAAMATGQADLSAYADHAYRFLAEHCLDLENGGVYWSMTYDGKPLDTTKHTYNQAFAIYALAAYYRLTGSAEALAIARGLFDVIETHCTDEGGLLEAFTVDWQPAGNEKLSENGVMAARTMNTLLHVLEGYSGLYAAAPDARLCEVLCRMLSVYEHKIYSPALQRQLVFFDRDYNSLIDLYSYGHDIESSWLTDWSASLLGDAALCARIAALNTSLVQNVRASAYYNHSLANECERGVRDTRRIWWVQAEAVLGFVNEFEKSGDAACAAAAADIFGFVRDTLTDPRCGEWFDSTDENGVPTPDKPLVQPWKCPYHNGRMCMELMRKDPDIEV